LSPVISVDYEILYKFVVVNQPAIPNSKFDGSETLTPRRIINS
jgi:hypothetical protein